MEHLQLHILLLVPFLGGIHSSFWLQVSEEGINRISQETIVHSPEVVFDLSSLIQNTSQLQITSVRVHSLGMVSAQIGLSDIKGDTFQAKWNISSFVVDVRGSISFMVFRFRIDSRIYISNSTLSLEYALDDDKLLSLRSCDFTFTIGDILVEDRRLERFVSVLRSRVARLPKQAICTRMQVLHAKRPLFMFGLPDSPKMIWKERVFTSPRVLLVRKSHLYIGFQISDKDGGTQIPVNIPASSPSMVSVYFSKSTMSYILGAVLKDYLQTEYAEMVKFSVSPHALQEFFEEGGTVTREKGAYHGFFSLDDIQPITVEDATDGLVMSSSFTLQYNLSSSCAEYTLFGFLLEMKLPVLLTYNNVMLLLGVTDIGVELTAINSHIGQSKNLNQIVKYLGMMENSAVQARIDDELKLIRLLFFLNNPGLLSDTQITSDSAAEFLILHGNIASEQTISGWRRYGTSLSGDDVTVNDDRDTEQGLVIDNCEIIGALNTGVVSHSVSSYIYMLPLFISLSLGCV